MYLTFDVTVCFLRFSCGGVVVTALDGKIVCDNTLDAYVLSVPFVVVLFVRAYHRSHARALVYVITRRLEIAYTQQLPVIRQRLFPEVKPASA